MAREHYDLVVIGAGPGGYVAAIRAAQLGLGVACVERERALGGTCLRIGCIPSKALLESSELYWECTHALAEHGVVTRDVGIDLATMMKRKDKTVTILTRGVDTIFKKNRVSRIEGRARFDGPGSVIVDRKDDTLELTARHFLIATGSKSASIPGVVEDGEWIATSAEALSYPSVPEHLVVVGAGAIGLELGSVWRRLGAKVTVLELLDRILLGMDRAIADDAQKILTKQGLTFQLGVRVTGARVVGGRCEVTIEGREPVRGDRLLVAVGRAPNTDGLGLERIGVEVDERGRIPVDEHFETSTPGVYAIGDVIGGPMLAHKASEEGIACVERIVTGFGHVNYDAIPNIVYTNPEVASVGRTEEQLREAGVPYRTGEFPFIANGRARALGHTEGRVKILAHAATDRILGVHILGPRAGDLIAEAALAIELGASSEDLARTAHAHPTLAETIKEASLAVEGRSIHI
jgi:dihydrolipoamide dehydrogenase